MSSLVELWKYEMKDPLGDIKNLLKPGNSGEIVRQMNGIDSMGFFPFLTPLTFLCMGLGSNFEGVKPAIIELLIHGGDMNVLGLSGLNPLHFLLILVFYDESYIDHVEWWLSLGANPNQQIYIQEMNYLFLTPLEFLLSFHSKNWTLDKFHLDHPLLNVLERRQLSEKEMKRMVLLLLCFESQKPEDIHDPGNLYDHLSSLLVNEISEAMLLEYPFLRKKLHHLWKIPYPLPDLYIRHRFLSRYYSLITPYAHPREHEGVYLIPTFEQDEFSPPHEFFKDQYKTYFHMEMIPSLIREGKNPVTNKMIPLSLKRRWLDRLEHFPIFPHRSPKENLGRLPFVFQPPSKPNRFLIMLDWIQEMMRSVHPYSNIVFVKKFKPFEVEFVVYILQNNPYFLSGFSRAKTRITLLEVILTYLLSADKNENINKIHFGFEECYEDIKMHKLILESLERTGSSFSYNFYEVMIQTEVFNLLSERIGYFSMYEMSILWDRICHLHALQSAPRLNENTFPLLLMN